MSGATNGTPRKRKTGNTMGKSAKSPKSAPVVEVKAEAAPIVKAPASRKVLLLSPDAIKLIGIDTPHKAGEHPLWDERNELPVNMELVASIVANGFKSTVRAREETWVEGEGKVTVAIDGRQRVRAARVANAQLRAEGKPEVLCECVLDKSGDSEAMGTMILSNEFRAEDDIITKARKAARYQASGKTPEEAASVFGVKVSTLESWATILELAPDLQAMVRDGVFPAKAATRLASVPVDMQHKVASQLVFEGKHTVEGAAQAAREVKAAAKRAKAGGTTENPSTPPVEGVHASKSSTSNEGTNPRGESSNPVPATRGESQHNSGPTTGDAESTATTGTHGDTAPSRMPATYPRPGMDLVRKVKRLADKGEASGMSLDARLMLAWFLGDGPAEDVHGLAEVIAKVNYKAPKAPKPDGAASVAAAVGLTT